MADINPSDGGILENYDGDEDFRSCCAEEDIWKELEDPAPDRSGENLDEFSMKMFFKGVSVCDADDSSPGISGIGVVLERAPGSPSLQVQKRLDLYVEPSVANHLALLDGLLEAQRVGARRISAFTDSELLIRQVTENGADEDHLSSALGRRIMEHADKLESFSLHLVSSSDLEKPLQLAQEAVGIFRASSNKDQSFQGCSICKENHPQKTSTLSCSHSFCSPCIRRYIQERSQASQIPVNCPHESCEHIISPSECFEADRSERIPCPFPSCSAWLVLGHFSENNSVECPECSRLVCFNCGVPWHVSMSCGEYQRADVSLRGNWRRCQLCSRVLERVEGNFRMICWCGHEFCFACGAAYSGGVPACGCRPWEEDAGAGEAPATGEVSGGGAAELWRWDLFDDEALGGSAYTEQERSQIALIQSFLAGGFGGVGEPAAGGTQSPPRCSDAYGDAMKDLRHLPWLETFVSFISDCYHDDYGQ